MSSSSRLVHNLASKPLARRTGRALIERGVVAIADRLKVARAAACRATRLDGSLGGAHCDRENGPLTPAFV